MDYVIGIDPGITGAVVVLNMDGGLEAAGVCPSVPTGKGNKRDYDIDGMRRLVEPYSLMAGKQSRCALELVGPMPKQGVTSMFNFGMGYGIWKGIVASHLMQMTLVKPKRWQDEMLAGYPRGEAVKQSAVRVAKARWPDIPITLKKDWGIADAALIAEWHRINSEHSLRVLEALKHRQPPDQDAENLRAIKKQQNKPNEEGE